MERLAKVIKNIGGKSNNSSFKGVELAEVKSLDPFSVILEE